MQVFKNFIDFCRFFDRFVKLLKTSWILPNILSRISVNIPTWFSWILKIFLHNSPGPKEEEKKENVQKNRKWNKLRELDVQKIEKESNKYQHPHEHVHLSEIKPRWGLIDQMKFNLLMDSLEYQKKSVKFFIIIIIIFIQRRVLSWK